MLAFIAVLAGLGTVTRVQVVGQFGTTFGARLPVLAGIVIVAVIGAVYCLTSLGLFNLLEEPRRRNWWLALGLLPVAAINVATPIILIAEEHVGVALVLDVYLVDGLLPLAVICLLLSRSAREFFRAAPRRAARH